MATVDSQLAANVARWPSMSRGRPAGAIDKIVCQSRPRRGPPAHQVPGRPSGLYRRRTDGLCELSGTLLQPDGMALDER